jgi:hypothetical protein
MLTLMRLRLQSAHPNLVLGWALRADIVGKPKRRPVSKLGGLDV